ncbi:BLUF domain-containing protein [Sphingomonas floccifaciens]|uniref:BLUF domain-containing protein n=1 Tax=Sphingomonas floccifaciens TaxID=1844115 RepID=A0ABW4NE19_9SPHN
MLSSWMYVSQATFPIADSRTYIEPIEIVSLRRNPELDVTGALIFAVRHFAQYIEGPPDAIALLRAAIERDGRHRDLHTVLEDSPEFRRFAGWQVSYSGLATYFEKTIVAAQANPMTGTEKTADPLLRLFREFSLPGRR